MDQEKFEVEDEFLTIGRTFAEYRRMFDLTVADLVGRTVLDCGGGAGAFTATAGEFADESVAVDPLYGPPPDVLEPELDAAVETTLEQLREKRGQFVWDFYGDPATRARYLRGAFERFLADYATHPGRYVAGALPDLGFDDDTADLALVANLLFTYDDRLDLDFHLDALREVARVAGEVRVFPLASLDGTRSEFVEPAVERLRAGGHDVELRPVPYEFQPGATEMAVVS